MQLGSTTDSISKETHQQALQLLNAALLANLLRKLDILRHVLDGCTCVPEEER